MLYYSNISEIQMNTHHNQNYKDGFTLSEVLITIVIIGIISAITVPAIIQKTQRQEFVSKLIKTHSTLARATNLIISEEGLPRYDQGGWGRAYNAYPLYKKHLINSRECGMNENCFANATYKLLSGNNATSFFRLNQDFSYSFYRLITADGVSIMFQTANDTCTAGVYGSQNICLFISVDLNGERKPNTWGRDVFAFVLKENGIYPHGCDIKDVDVCKTTDGIGCACKVLRESNMNY